MTKAIREGDIMAILSKTGWSQKSVSLPWLFSYL